MSIEVMNAIKKDTQIKKFSAYGFLKNLKFFEPYLVLFLLGNGLNFFQIGILYAIREGITYIFEVPSGFIADYFGRKKELYLCFSFYIISFIFFFLIGPFWIAVIGMSFFGLGEAFRSGTHKAMIYTYLEEKGWQGHKAFVYGRTRSFSLIGSAISSIVAIFLILNIPSSRYIFLASIVPYILDLFLIMSYPESLNGERIHVEGPVLKVMKDHLAGIIKQPMLRKILLSSASFESVFKSIKDYIQPILEMLIVSSGLVLISTMTPDENLKVILGMSYGIIYILSATAARRAYLLKKLMSSIKLLNVFYVLLSFCMIGLFFIIRLELYLLIIILYLVLYLLRDMRKPIFVDVCDDYMEKHQRATVLSVESQLRALFTVILAPVIGFVADQFGVSYVMLSIGILLLVSFAFFRIKE